MLVTKDELLDAVWPETNVADTVLKVCIREIREALNDDAVSPRFIETAHRRGYRFVAPVTESLTEANDSESSSRSRDNLAGLQIPDQQSEPMTMQVGSLIGRKSEMESLTGWLNGASRGRRQIIFVSGEPGIGKTTVVEALLQQASTAPDVLVARGQCIEHYGAGEAYLPMLEAVSRLCRLPRGEQVISLLARQAPTWLAQMPGLIDEREREDLQKSILGIGRERMLREMAEALETLTAAVTLVVALEDLHWSDSSTLDLISYLARRIESARLMIVGTYRPAEHFAAGHPLRAVKQELLSHRLCTELQLDLLSEESVREFLGVHFRDNRFPVNLATLIHQRTEGNPLFMVNVADYFVDQGLIAELDGRWELTRELSDIDIGVPAGIRQLIERQIDRLTESEQGILEAASVAGVEFWTTVVAAALDRSVVEVEESCESLVRNSQLLERRLQTSSRFLGARCGFKHALYRNVLLDRVPSARRAQFHQRIGLYEERVYKEDAIQIATELAVHFDEGRDYERAVKYLAAAADNAIRRFAYPESVVLGRRALELLDLTPETPDRIQQELVLLIMLSVPLAATQGYGSSVVQRTCNRALELCHRSGDNLQLSPALWGLWRFYLIRAEFATAREFAQQMLRVAQSNVHQSEPLAEAHLALGTTFVNIGDFASSLEQFQNGITVTNTKGAHISLYGHDPGIICHCFASWAEWALGYPDSALSRIESALNSAQQLNHPETIAFALFFSTWLRQLRQESAECLRLAQLTVAHGIQYGLVQWVAFGKSLLGWALCKAGHTEEGIREMRESLGTYRAIGSEVSRPHFLGLLAESLGQSGNLEEALALIDEAINSSLSSGGRYYEAELYRLRGEVSLLVPGRNTELVTRAEKDFLTAIDIARSQEAKSPELRATVSLSRWRQRQGQLEEARLALVEILAKFSEGFDTPDVAQARKLVTELSSSLFDLDSR